MRKADLWFLVGVALILLAILMFWGVVRAATCDRWVSESDIVTGLGDVGEESSPALCYNCTGTGHWELIVGKHYPGFYGFYWNGTQWVSDSSIVAGLSAGYYSKPAICNNCTGHGVSSGNGWELIRGDNDGQFYGFYWNGTQWVSDSSIVAGLGDIGDKSAPAICYNCTGNGYWEIIAGSGAGGFYGFYWNGTQWVSDSSIINGISGVGAVPYSGWAAPTFCNDCTGSGHWELIIGTGYGGFVGYYWNGTQWVSDSSIVAGLSKFGHGTPTIGYNCTGSGHWELISGEEYGNFFGFEFVDTYDGVVHITQNATAGSSEVGIGENISIWAKAYSQCGLRYANISIYHSETGTWADNDGTFSQQTLSNNDDIQTANFTGHPAVAYCNNTIKAKITFLDWGGATATTAETSFEYNPYIASSGNTSIIPTGLMSEVDGCNATISALASGSTWFLARVGFKYRNATFRECPYEATNADDWKITNTSEYCLINVTTQSLSSGDTVRIQSSEAYSAYPPPNLPSAIAAAGLIIIVIYTITTRRS